MECFASDTTFFLDESTTRNDLRWVYWLLQTLRLDEGSGETAIPGLSRETAYENEVPVPPLVEQRAIAGYLDRETGRLDALMAAKERWLELLAEKRRALITRAVTRGLNPTAPLRDSGFPWLGQVPKHWELKRLRWLSKTIEQGWSPQADSATTDNDSWAVIKLSAIKSGGFYDQEHKGLPTAYEIPTDLEIKRGDFLLTRANTPSLVGDVCVVKKTRPKLIFSDLVFRLRLRETLISAEFLAHFLLTAGRVLIEADARGSSQSMVKISQEHIPNWFIPLPPLAEQRAIVAHIATATAKLDGLRAAAEQTIALLKERRAALIAAAVTGKLELGRSGLKPKGDLITV